MLLLNKSTAGHPASRRAALIVVGLGIFRLGRTGLLLAALFGCFLLCSSNYGGQVDVCGAAEQAAPIPESEITALEERFKKERGQGSSAVDIRRACKSAARKGQALLREAPEAPNRFAVLGIIFRAQKTLLAQTTTELNAEALFATCEELAKAPDAYTEFRLEADLLLSERELSEKDATLAEHAEALAGVLERYKGTSAEAKSLLMGALIVRKLDARVQ